MGLRVIAMDVGVDKGKLCLDVGADEYIDVSQGQDVAAKVKEITGFGGMCIFFF